MQGHGNRGGRGNYSSRHMSNEPSMDNSGKIITAKHNEFQTFNVKSVGAYFEVVSDRERLPLGVKELGTCDLYPHVNCAYYVF
uniref:Uncharacterized protein n=1 Tax=Lactuca sativa TaxID=4236 RepID=A0A9R1XIG9_LACSA|nr:hypothetical protein LSAT_V11C400199840 [Lactuca sativa]